MSDHNEQNNDPSTDPGTGQSSTGQGTQTSASSGSVNESQQPAGYVSEESYKGLQRAAEKKRAQLETQLAKTQAELEAAHTTIEEQKITAAKAADLEKQKAELDTTLSQLQSERDQLNRQIAQQKIILSEFPDIASLSAYIPAAQTDDEFRTNATAFKAALETFTKGVVKTTLAGSTPPIGSGNNAGNQQAEIDRLWDIVDKTAGNPSKLNEFEEANAQLQELYKKK